MKNHKSYKKFQSDTSILKSIKAGLGNCLTVALNITPPPFSCE